MAKKISLLANGDPTTLNQDSLLEYKELTIRYPYCQCARLMFLLNLRQIDDQAAYKSALPVTAINLPDRTRLKEQVDSLQPTPQAMSQSRQAFPMPQEPLPRRHVESFSPWSQALPRSVRPLTQPQPKAQVQEDRQNTPRQENPGFTPVVETPAYEKRPVQIEEVRTLLNKKKLADQTAKNRPRANADAIIDNFLSGNSEHSIKIDENFDYNSFDPDTGRSNREDFSLGGETLAQMYLSNNAPKKAIAVYENLRLKFPEKSSYFANLISKVKKDYHIK